MSKVFGCFATSPSGPRTSARAAKTKHVPPRISRYFAGFVSFRPRGPRNPRNIRVISEFHAILSGRRRPAMPPFGQDRGGDLVMVVWGFGHSDWVCRLLVLSTAPAASPRRLRGVLLAACV